MASQKGIRAGKAFVEVFVDNTKLVRGLRMAEVKVRRFGRQVENIGRQMAGLGAAVAAPMALAVKHFSSYGDQVAKMAKRTGVSVEALSELQFVASQTGTDIAGLENGLRKMQRSIYDAGRGLSTQTDALTDLGLSYKDLEGLAPEEQFKVLADRLGKLTDDTNQAAIAQSLFGRAGTQLIPMFEAGADGIQALQERARELGLTMSDEDAAAAEQFTDAMDELIKSLKMAVFQVGGALAPEIEKLQADMLDVIKGVRQWVEDNSELLVKILKVTAAVAAFGATAIIIGKVTVAVSSLIGVVRGLATAMSFLIAHPVVAFLAGITVAATAVGYALKKAYSHTVDLSDAMQDQLAASDELRRHDQQRLQQLQQLADKGKLNNNELQTATDILGHLTRRYGDLGIAVDSATGQITGMAGAQQRLNDAMREAAAMDLEAAIFELQQNLGKLRAEAEQIAKDFEGRGLDVSKPQNHPNGLEAWFSEVMPWGDENERKEWQNLVDQMRPMELRLDAALIRRDALESGYTDAITNTPSADPVMPPPAADMDATAAAEAEQARWARRVRQLRIQQMGNDLDREKALINERYDYEMQKAREADATAETLAAIQKARAIELQQAIAKAADDAAKAETQAAEEAARRREAIAQSNAARLQSIEELTLRKQYEGVELQQKLLDLEEARAMAAARAAGENLDLVRREYDLRRQLEAGATAFTEQARRTNETRGGFSSAALDRIGYGSRSVFTEIAKATGDTARGVQKLNDKADDGGGLVFGG